MDPFGGGSWTMVPTPNATAHNDQFQQQQQQFHLQQQFQLQQQQQFKLQQQQQLQMQQQQQQKSLVSHFDFLHLIESLARTIESGTRDQHLDALVNELTSQFDKCQKLLITISSTLNDKGVTVERQKLKLEEAEKLLQQRRDLIAKYRSSVEDLLNSDNTI